MVGAPWVLGPPSPVCGDLTLAWSTGLSLGVVGDPAFHRGPAPHPPGGERHLGRGEVVELPGDLVGALAGHAEDLRDLGDTDEVVAHTRSVAETLDRRQRSLIPLR